MRTLMREIAIKAKIRIPPDGDAKTRKDITLFHGMRKFHYRALNRADIKPEVREFLMGHKTGNSAMGVSNLMMIYDATEDNEALFSYLKVIPSLTIFEANVLMKELDETKIKLSLEQEQRNKIREEILSEIAERNDGELNDMMGRMYEMEDNMKEIEKAFSSKDEIIAQLQSELEDKMIEIMYLEGERDKKSSSSSPEGRS